MTVSVQRQLPINLRCHPRSGTSCAGTTGADEEFDGGHAATGEVSSSTRAHEGVMLPLLGFLVDSGGAM